MTEVCVSPKQEEGQAMFKPTFRCFGLAATVTRCTQCGACNQETNYRHDPDCILNVCLKDMSLLQCWKNGRNGLLPAPEATDDQKEAHRMGKAIRDKFNPPLPDPVPYHKPCASLGA